MKNKILLLRGKIKCRVIDTILENGTTFYFVMDLNSEKLSLIKPRDVLDILNNDLESNAQHIIKYGI